MLCNRLGKDIKIIAMTIKYQVLRTLCNHRNCTSGGIAHILNVPRFKVLRALKELVNEGEVRVQRGRVEDGVPDKRWRSYKLAKEKYVPIEIF
jgi:predicted ArsR family transcriptional regulator